MKTLADGYQVPDRIYYYLLDFNDVNERQVMISEFNEVQLCKLKLPQFKKLFEIATKLDIEKLIK